MKLLAAFVAHERRLALRSLRFRISALLYVAAATAPAVVAWLRRGRGESLVGSASYALETQQVLPALTAVFALLLSVDALTREREEGSWSTLSLCGVSSGGYLLYRWLSLQVLLLPLSALPVALSALAAGAALGGPAAVDPGAFVFPWLMHVVPLAASVSAFGLGVGTIAGGPVGAVVLGGFWLYLLPYLLNSALFALGMRVPGPTDAFFLQQLGISLRRLTQIDSPGRSFGGAFPLPASDAPFDPAVAAEQLVHMLAFPAALAALALGLAVRYLRRTRPDVRPWRIRPDHPLRTFLGTVARLRERYTVDPRPSRADLLVLGLGLLVAAGAVLLLDGRARHYEALGRVRYDAERRQGPPPTPADVLPGRWRIAGRIGPGRGVDLTVTAEVVNRGRVPRSHLAFSLNPHLRLREASTARGPVAVKRAWDRLSLELSTPLAPGERRTLRFRLAGEPAQILFTPTTGSYVSFQKRFDEHLHAQFARSLLDFSASYRISSLSPRRIELEAMDLTPLPRYQTWQLDDDRRVRKETFHPQADLELDLATPRGVLLAGSCGDLGSDGRLQGSCRLPLSELAVLGGRYRLLPAPAAGPKVAVYPTHAALGELHLGFVGQGAVRLEQAWPGLEDPGRMAVLEWPGDERLFSIDPLSALWSYRPYNRFDLPFVMLGNLVLVAEEDVKRKNVLLKPEVFTAAVVTERLSRRRTPAIEDAQLFNFLLRRLVFERLGLGVRGGAAVGPLRPGWDGLVRIPPPADTTSWLYWESRFGPLVSGLGHLMGEETLRQAVDEVLSREPERPATRQELYAVLERRGGPEARRFIADNLLAGGIAEPVLDAVELRQTGEGWQVTGRVQNRGDALARCRVVLATDLGPVETLVRAEPGGASPFVLTSRRRPLTVFLDPERECHRLIPNGAPRDRVFFEAVVR